MKDSDMESPVVLVTGAASGIGAAVAATFRAHGNCVAVADRAPEIANSPHGFQADVTNEESVSHMVEAIESRLGPIGTLVNCAGVLYPGSLLDTSVKDWDEMMAVNARGVMVVTQAVARAMVPRRSGSIVTVASNAASVPRTTIGAYAATKSAATHVTRCFGLELAEYGIRCNVVAPGSTDTPMLAVSLAGGDRSSVLEGNLSQFRLGIPLGRIASADDIANAVWFLSSSRARHITMQELTVDGGASLHLINLKRALVGLLIALPPLVQNRKAVPQLRQLPVLRIAPIFVIDPSATHPWIGHLHASCRHLPAPTVIFLWHQ